MWLRFLHLDEQVSFCPNPPGGHEFRACINVGGVLVAAALTGAVLDESPVAVPSQISETLWRQTDAVLLGLGLSNRADDQRFSSEASVVATSRRSSWCRPALRCR